MARVRSPSYPSYPIEDAIENARTVFEKDRRSPVAREVVAKHLGYKSLNGAADKSLATMMQYGMLEKVAKGEVSVTQWAIDILFPDNPSERLTALKNAASNPPLFRALNERFPDGPPSNDTLQAYLLREEFNDRAIGPITTAYGKTCAFLEREGASESSIPSDETGTDSSSSESETVFGGAKVGDLIQWEVNDQLQMEAPMRVRAVSDDGMWVAVEGSETGIPMQQVIVEENIAPVSAPPIFKIEPEKREVETVRSDETEWISNLVGRDTKVRLLVSGGEMGAKEIGKLIKLLEAQRSVLSDDDD